MSKKAISNPITETTQSEYEILSISKLAFRFNLDRATVKKRLVEANVQPVEESENEKLYELTEELQSILTFTTKPIDLAKLETVQTTNEIKKLELQKRKGELLTVVEVKDAVNGIFGGLQKEIVQNLPKKIAPKLKRAKTIAEITAILKQELDVPFGELASDYTKFLN